MVAKQPQSQAAPSKSSSCPALPSRIVSKCFKARMRMGGNAPARKAISISAAKIVQKRQSFFIRGRSPSLLVSAILSSIVCAWDALANDSSLSSNAPGVKVGRNERSGCLQVLSKSRPLAVSPKQCLRTAESMQFTAPPEARMFRSGGWWQKCVARGGGVFHSAERGALVSKIGNAASRSFDGSMQVERCGGAGAQRRGAEVQVRVPCFANGSFRPDEDTH